MHDRPKLEAECLVTISRALITDSRIHLARLGDDLAATRAAVDAMQRSLGDWRRMLAEIERRERYGPQRT